MTFGPSNPQPQQPHPAQDTAPGPGGGDPGRPPEEREGLGRVITSLVSMVVLAALAIGGMFIPVPYVVEQPGPAIDVLGDFDDEKVLSIDGHRTYPSSGELMMTTVSVNGGPGFTVRPAEVIWAWFDRDKAVTPRELHFPDEQTQQQTDLQNTAAMNTSQQEAVAVALDELDIDYEEGVFVSGVEQGAPADGVLEPGDEVLAVGGERAADPAGYQEAVQAVTPGDEVPVTVRRDGHETDLHVPTEEVDGATRMGVVFSPGYDFPFDVAIGVGDIGGPSAGTMFALSVYDQLTPEDLLDGEAVAGTGTIDIDGNVGAIGGIRQKMAGARESGAEYFLAPGDNCEEVTGYEPEGMDVVRTDTFDDALEAVETIGETGSTDGLPTCGD